MSKYGQAGEEWRFLPFRPFSLTSVMSKYGTPSNA